MAATTAPASAAAVADSASLMKRLTSLAEVNRALAEVASRERAIDAKLQTLLSGRAELEAGLAAIEDDTKNVREKKKVMRVGIRGRRGGREASEESFAICFNREASIARAHPDEQKWCNLNLNLLAVDLRPPLRRPAPRREHRVHRLPVRARLPQGSTARRGPVPRAGGAHPH